MLPITQASTSEGVASIAQPAWLRCLVEGQRTPCCTPACASNAAVGGQADEELRRVANISWHPAGIYVALQPWSVGQEEQQPCGKQQRQRVQLLPSWRPAGAPCSAATPVAGCAAAQASALATC